MRLEVGADGTALVCQHLGDVVLADAIADAVVDADNEENPRLDEVCLYTEKLQWPHSWVVKRRSRAEVFRQQLLLEEMALPQAFHVICCRKILGSQVSFAFVMVS